MLPALHQVQLRKRARAQPVARDPARQPQCRAASAQKPRRGRPAALRFSRPAAGRGARQGAGAAILSRRAQCRGGAHKARAAHGRVPVGPAAIESACRRGGVRLRRGAAAAGGDAGRGTAAVLPPEGPAGAGRPDAQGVPEARGRPFYAAQCVSAGAFPLFLSFFE